MARPGTRPADPPVRRSSGSGGLVAAVLLGGAAAVVVFADVLGIDDRTPLVQVIAFRPVVAAGLVVLALLAATGGRGARPVALALALVGLAGLAVVAPRAVGAPTPTGDGPTLTVLTLNTYLGRADPDAVADLVRARDPAVVVLPEAGGELRSALRSRLDEDAGGTGYRSSVAQDADDASPMTVFLRRDLGRPTVTEDRSGTHPTIVADLPRGLRVVATHPRSPKPGDTRQWARDVAGLARWCTDGRPTIVAGDMNSTADHREFRDATASCTDAAPAVGAGLVGTWPAGVPRVLAAPIDHVLTAGGVTPVAADVVDVAGSDHRALLATVRGP